MYFIAIACVSNIILDYLFIGFFHFGPAGAALGTTVSQAISVLAALISLYIHPTGLSVSLHDLRPRRNIMGQILKIGIPVAMQDGLIQVAFIIITIIANRRGLNTAAAVGIVEKVITSSFWFHLPRFLPSLHWACTEYRSRKIQPCHTDPSLCNLHRSRFWTDRVRSDSGYRSICGFSLHL